MILKNVRRIIGKKNFLLIKKILKNKTVLMTRRKMVLESEKIVNLFVVQKADNN